MMRILLVEDDRMIGAAVTQALKDAAYAVDWVMDGQTAIDAAEAEAYDLALLDLSLPAIDGLEVLRCLRKGDARSPSSL
jgi:two-component system OmpR family response regulator